MEDGLNTLEHEDIEDSEDEEERELGREESEEPLRGEHVSLETNILEVLPQVGHVLLQQPVQLVEPQLQLLKVLSVQISETISKHDLHQDSECLFLRHLKQERGNQEALSLAVSDL